MSTSQVAQSLRFDTAAEQRLLAGEIVTAEREETTAKQLAVAIGMLKATPTPWRRPCSTTKPAGQSAILGFGKNDPSAPEAGLAGAAFTSGEGR